MISSNSLEEFSMSDISALQSKMVCLFKIELRTLEPTNDDEICKENRVAIRVKDW